MIGRKFRAARLPIAGVAIIVILVTVGAVYFRYGGDRPMLDPISEIRMERLLAAGVISPDSPIGVLFETKSKRDSSTLQAWGLQTRFCWDKYCTAIVQQKRIAELASHREMQWIKLGDIGSSQNKGQPDRPPLIGIIDAGIDWRDRSLWTAAGPRIAYYWDQTDHKGPGPAFMGSTSYGTELAGYQLSEFRDNLNVLSPTAGHGTQMARLAAGDLPGQVDTNIGTVLEENILSPIIVVNITGNEMGVLDAVRYIIRRGEEMGVNRVINLSYSKHTGTHDAQDPFVQALDASLDERTLLVESVGNDAVRGINAAKNVRGTVDIPLLLEQRGCPKGKRVSFEVEGWYDRRQPIDFRLEPPGGETEPNFLHAGEVFGGQHGPDHFLMDARLRSSNDDKFGVHITAESECSGVRSELGWHLIAHSESGSLLRLWVTQTSECAVVFPEGSVQGGAVSVLAGSQKAISVGAYTFTDNQAAPAIYSSFGRLEDGRWKPDLMAPSPALQSSEDATGGTSAAAAVATRWISRFWAQNRHMTADDVRRALTAKVIVPPMSGVEWKNDTRYHPITLPSLTDLIRNSESSNTRSSEITSPRQTSIR